MKLRQLSEGIQSRTQRWRKNFEKDFEEDIEMFAELAPDLEPGGREYIGELDIDPDFESMLTLPMMREFRKKMIALNHTAIHAGEEWLVDERYQLIHDLLLKYKLATKI